MMSREMGRSRVVKMMSLTGSVLLCVLLSAGMMTLSGCKKPPPPVVAPPPPPPPPPPPVEVSLADLSKELKLDAKVTTIAGLTVTEDKKEIAEAALRLADAFAKGDAKAAKEQLTLGTHGLVDELEASGGWEQATKSIKEVRIVVLKDGVDRIGVGQAGLGAVELPTMILAKVQSLSKEFTPEENAAMEKALNESMSTVDKEELQKDPVKLLNTLFDKVVEASKKANIPQVKIDRLSSVRDEIIQITSSLKKGATSSGTTSGYGMLMALQDDQGAYLLGWAAERVGDKWLFTNTPSSPDVRLQASLFDGIGAEGFQAVRLAAAPPPAAAASKDAPKPAGK